MIDMKAAFLAATLAVAAASIAPAAADYRTCMEFCIKEHGFARCDKTCAGRAGQMEGAPKAPAKLEELCKVEVSQYEKEIGVTKQELRGVKLGDPLLSNPPRLLRKYFSDEHWRRMHRGGQAVQSEDDPNLFEFKFYHRCPSVMIRKYSPTLGRSYETPGSLCVTRHWSVKARFINDDCDVKIVEPPKCIGQTRRWHGKFFPCSE